MLVVLAVEMDMSAARDDDQSRGFTLVELLVVIAIIGVLVALLLPAVQAARGAARRIQCTNNLKQVALAIHNYHTANNAQPAYHDTANPYGWWKTGPTWTMLILPYMEEQAMYDQFDFTVLLLTPARRMDRLDS